MLHPMPTLAQVVAFCDKRVRVREVADFPGALNGLQVANSGRVTKIGATVDAGAVPFALAAKAGVDFLIVHHGLFWDGAQPVTGAHHARLKTLLDADCAVYSAHLPLDAHPKIGNNALIAKALGLRISGWGIPYQGTPIAAFIGQPPTRAKLRARLLKLFPPGITAIEFGPLQPRKLAILSGSGSSCIPHLRDAGVDTLITGELKQSAFNAAQEAGLNLYICGHYATETFGVRALAKACAARFRVPWEFLDTGCPL
ncbi:MAG TPA: Nif3-like dinuclear metal center hexameric protein [Opitutales bacterium]|nr:Nif3-like dinuclear metal center hexameric protein [Opitutales bacterium]